MDDWGSFIGNLATKAADTYVERERIKSAYDVARMDLQEGQRPAPAPAAAPISTSTLLIGAVVLVGALVLAGKG